MPECRDCSTFIMSGSRCQVCRLEHQHGTLADRRDNCTVCGSTIRRGAPRTTVDGGPAHKECKGQLRCDGGRDLLEVELVLGAQRAPERQVNLGVGRATVTDREHGKLEITLVDDGIEDYLAELGLKNTTDTFAGGDD